jgi:hypothetical protein
MLWRVLHFRRRLPIRHAKEPTCLPYPRLPSRKKWPTLHPERIQRCSLSTPNGQKVGVMMEETGLPYEPHLVSFDSNGSIKRCSANYNRIVRMTVSER